MGCTNFIYLLFFLVFFTIAAAADPIKKLKSEVNVEAHDEQHPTRFEVLFFYFYHSNYRFFFFSLIKEELLKTVQQQLLNFYP